jgi:hypothetical protein
VGGARGVAGARAALGAAMLGDQSAARELIDQTTSDDALDGREGGRAQAKA